MAKACALLLSLYCVSHLAGALQIELTADEPSLGALAAAISDFKRHTVPLVLSSAGASAVTVTSNALKDVRDLSLIANATIPIPLNYLNALVKISEHRHEIAGAVLEKTTPLLMAMEAEQKSWEHETQRRFWQLVKSKDLVHDLAPLLMADKMYKATSSTEDQIVIATKLRLDGMERLHQNLIQRQGMAKLSKGVAGTVGESFQYAEDVSSLPRNVLQAVFNKNLMVLAGSLHKDFDKLAATLKDYPGTFEKLLPQLHSEIGAADSTIEMQSANECLKTIAAVSSVLTKPAIELWLKYAGSVADSLQNNRRLDTLLKLIPPAAMRLGQYMAVQDAITKYRYSVFEKERSLENFGTFVAALKSVLPWHIVTKDLLPKLVGLYKEAAAAKQELAALAKAGPSITASLMIPPVSAAVAGAGHNVLSREGALIKEDLAIKAYVVEEALDKALSSLRKYGKA